MSWRERAREIQKCPSGEVSKVSKDPFGPFETAQDGRSETFRARNGDGAPDTTLLADFRKALVIGRLVVCCNCAHFTASAERGELGHCRQFDTESWPFVPLACAGFTVSPKPAAPAYLPDPYGARALGRRLACEPSPRTRRAP